MATLAAYPQMMRRDRQRLGLRECRAAWLLGITVGHCRRHEAGDDELIQAEVWERMIDVFGRPRLETWINGTSKRLHVITRMEGRRAGRWDYVVEFPSAFERRVGKK